MPIAMRRYEESNPESDQLDLVSNKKADPRPGAPFADCTPGVDCHYRGTSVPESLPARYGVMDFYGLKEGFKASRTGDVQSAQAGNIDCDLPPEDGTYEGICVLGVHVQTNRMSSPTENYAGWVSLDIRNIVGSGSDVYETSPAYLNNATGQAATNKALSRQWFCKRGWTGDVPPMLGDQLAFLPGVSADFAPKEMLACDPPWKVGDKFIAVVYSGHVWDVPDLEVEIEPDYHEVVAGHPWPETHEVTYTIILKKPPESPVWKGQANFRLSASFTEQGGAITPTIAFPEGNEVTLEEGDDEKTVTMTVSVTDPESSSDYVDYVSALTVEATETSIGLERWASTNFGYLATPPGNPSFDEDFTVYAQPLEFNVVQGAKVSVSLPTMAFGGFIEKKAPVRVMVGGVDCGLVFTAACNGETIDIPNNKDTIGLRVRTDAIVGEYPVTLTVDPDTFNVPSHSVSIVVNVKPPSGGDPTRFVIVEGFVDVEITYLDNNDVIAYVIGPIVPEITSSELYSMNPSLLPW